MMPVCFICDTVERTSTRGGNFRGIVQWKRGYRFKVRECNGVIAVEDNEKYRIHSCSELKKVSKG